MSAYIVFKQHYEEFFVYGVYLSRDKLDAALDELAQLELEEAKESRQELQSWFDHNHTPWAKHVGMDPVRPPRLDMDIIEYSKTLFSVDEIEVDKVISKPLPMGWVKREAE